MMVHSPTLTPPKQMSTRSVSKDGNVTREPQQTRDDVKPTRGSCFRSVPAVQVTDVEIHYGTMFGAAERYARALAHELTIQRQLRVAVYDLDAFDDATFVRRDRFGPTRLCVFVVSTHFAGAPSPSAERFRDWINASVATPLKSTDAKPTTGSDLSPSSATNSTKAQEAGARSLWSLRRRREPMLRDMQYAVFGVGDSVYLTYNAMGKFVDLKLRKLGAVRFHPLGLGDTSNDMETTFKLWQTALLAKLPIGVGADYPTTRASEAAASNAVVPLRPDRSADSLEEDGGNERSRGPASATESQISVKDNFGRKLALDFHCRVVPENQVNSHHLFTLYPSSDSATTTTSTPLVDTASASLGLGPRTPRIALFDREPFAEIEAIEVRPDYGGNPNLRRAATFSVHLLNPETTYISVSTLALFPQNSVDHVTRIAEAFGFNLDAVIELVPLSTSENADLQRQQLPFPTPCTVRTALTEFLEVRTVTREFVRAAAGFVVTLDERAMLEHLGSSEGTTAFRTQIVEPFKGILDLIAMAPTLQIPLEVFVNITPPLKPRFFSIASSPKVTPHEVEIAVSVGVPGKPQGLCVSFLERVLALPQGSRVPFRGFISWSRFQFQDDGVSPMVLIAMGVGLSAMRSIIQERLARWLHGQTQTVSSLGRDKGGGDNGASRPATRTAPPLLLFLGSTTKDLIVFHHDLNHWEQQMLVKVHYAFSNDPRHARRRVHEVVASRMEEIVDVVKSSNGARIFVCGRVSLVHRIRDMFEVDQLRRGSRWFDAVQSSGRFIEEGFI